MVALLPSPILQFSDANGAPYAGGSILTFIPGTTTPVTTWSESTGTAANTNPIVLNAAGECTIYASGIVRMVLRDASGNTVFDQPSNTLVSVAMAPVCIAPDIATAQALLGITNSTAALATLTTGLSTETAARVAADATLTTNLAAEISRAEAAEAVLTADFASIGSTALFSTVNARSVPSVRNWNVGYTNSLTRPIFVSVVAYSGGTPYSPMSLIVSGQTVCQVTSQTAGGSLVSTVSGIVPAGATYQVSQSTWTSIQSWMEIT